MKHAMDNVPHKMFIFRKRHHMGDHEFKLITKHCILCFKSDLEKPKVQSLSSK